MARRPRRYGNSGVYHLIIRGVDRQRIFEDNADYQFFLHTLERYAKEQQVRVLAYCLMDNHVHLMVFIAAETLPPFMKKLGISYAAYFNGKYDRCGHLFQDRYKSESIENNGYLARTIRYILRNPLKAGLGSPQTYPWSSFSLYGTNNSLVDTSIFESLWQNEEEYRRYVLDDSEEGEEIMEYESQRDRGDARAVQRIREILQIDRPAMLQEMPKEQRDEAIRLLLASGIGIRQLSRLTGISRSLIGRLGQ